MLNQCRHCRKPHLPQARYCRYCGRRLDHAQLAVRAASRHPKITKPALAALLAAVVLAMTEILWALAAGSLGASFAAPRGIGGAPSAAGGLSAVTDQLIRAETRPQAAVIPAPSGSPSENAPATTTSRTNPPAGLQRVGFPQYGAKLYLPTGWKEQPLAAVQQLPGFPQQELDRLELDLIGFYLIGAAQSSGCVIFVDRNEEANPDITQAELRGKLIIKDPPLFGGQEVQVRFRRIAGRPVAVTDVWREGDAYVAAIILMAPERLFYFCCLANDRSAARDVQRQLRTSLAQAEFY